MGSARLRSKTWDTGIPTSATLHKWVKEWVSPESGRGRVMQWCKYTVSGPMLCYASRISATRFVDWKFNNLVFDLYVLGSVMINTTCMVCCKHSDVLNSCRPHSGSRFPRSLTKTSLPKLLIVRLGGSSQRLCSARTTNTLTLTLLRLRLCLRLRPLQPATHHHVHHLRIAYDERRRCVLVLPHSPNLLVDVAPTIVARQAHGAVNAAL
jgi:hypothetical protein